VGVLSFAISSAFIFGLSLISTRAFFQSAAVAVAGLFADVLVDDVFDFGLFLSVMVTLASWRTLLKHFQQPIKITRFVSVQVGFYFS